MHIPWCRQIIGLYNPGQEERKAEEVTIPISYCTMIPETDIFALVPDTCFSYFKYFNAMQTYCIPFSVLIEACILTEIRDS